MVSYAVQIDHILCIGYLDAGELIWTHFFFSHIALMAQFELVAVQLEEMFAALHPETKQVTTSHRTGTAKRKSKYRKYRKINPPVTLIHTGKQKELLLHMLHDNPVLS